MPLRYKQVPKYLLIGMFWSIFQGYRSFLTLLRGVCIRLSLDLCRTINGWTVVVSFVVGRRRKSFIELLPHYIHFSPIKCRTSSCYDWFTLNSFLHACDISMGVYTTPLPYIPKFSMVHNNALQRIDLNLWTSEKYERHNVDLITWCKFEAVCAFDHWNVMSTHFECSLRDTSPSTQGYLLHSYNNGSTHLVSSLTTRTWFVPRWWGW